MKRILSIFLTVAMLATMLATAVCAYDVDVYNGISTENVMSFIVTDANGEEKTTFSPGETIWITAKMDSIWGDPEIEDDIVGYDGNVLPGAYGMAIITSTLVFPTDVFTPKAGKDIKSLDSTINNAGIDPTTEETYEMNITKTSLSDAKEKGMYVFLTESDTFNGDEDQYAFFTGEGVLCRWVLTANEGASGTYKLPIGAYKWYDGGATKYEFFGKEYGYSGHSDSMLADRPVKFMSPTDEYVNDNPVDGAYITINVSDEGGSVTPPEPPVVENPMTFEFAADDNEYAAGNTVNVTLSVKDNEGLDESAISSQFSYDNTALKLISVTTPVAGLEAPSLNYDALNAQGSYEDLGKLTKVDAFFTGSASVTEDTDLITLTFEVLPTAAGAETKVSGYSNEDYQYPDAVIKLAANHTHEFSDTVTPATCTTSGYTDTGCDCGLTYRTPGEPKFGHTASTKPEDKVTVPATCTTEGYTTTYCATCGGVAKVDKFAALGHDFETVTAEVSCTSDGYTMKKCKTCGYEEDKVITATAYGHKHPDGSDAYGPEYIAKKPTTSEVGYYGRDCALCGDVWMCRDIAKLDIMWGDNNMDGKINITDVSVLLKYLAKWKDLYFSLDNADVTHDGRVNALDASKLLKYIAKWDVDLSEGPTVVG